MSLDPNSDGDAEGVASETLEQLMRAIGDTHALYLDLKLGQSMLLKIQIFIAIACVLAISVPLLVIGVL